MARQDYPPDADADTVAAAVASRSHDLRAGIERRLISLEEHSIAQLEGCNGPLDLHAELVDGIRQDVAHIEHQLEDLSLIAEEAPTEKLRSSILQSVDFLSARLSSARVKAREETLRSKRRIDSSNASSQRDALLGSSKTSNTNNPSTSTTSNTSKDDELINATANVTDGLRKTRQLLEQELERSSMSTQILERSSQTLTLTSDQYTSFSGLLNASKNLITTMQKADTLDRLLILAALLFFGLVCVLIIKRRIIDRGIRAATLFSRIAGAGSAPLRNAIPSNIKSAVSAQNNPPSAVKATVQDLTYSVTSVLSSVLASATMVAASVTTSSLPSPPATMQTSSQQDAQQATRESHQAEDPVTTLSLTESLATTVTLGTTAVPLTMEEESVEVHQRSEDVEVPTEELSTASALYREHIMNEL